MLKKDQLLKGLQDETLHPLVEKVLTQTEQALIEYRPVLTPFFSPSVLYLLQDILGEVEDLKVLGHGGYQQAKRKRLQLCPLYYLPPLDEDPVLLLEISRVNLGEEDLQQSIQALGMDKGAIGDVLTGETGMQLVCIPELAEPLKRSLTSTYPGILVERIQALCLGEQEGEGRVFSTTVASMRLDAIASSGVGLSRSRMKREILLEKVKVNWKVEKNPDRFIDVNDVIFIEGRGRLQIQQIQGRSKRGRIKLLLIRYF